MALGAVALLCACASPDARRGAGPAPVTDRYPPAARQEPLQPVPALPEEPKDSAGVVTTPLLNAPLDSQALPPSGTPGTKPATASDQLRGAHFAVILPLGSPALGSLAESFKQGFAAAAAFDGKEAPRYRIYAAENEADSLTANFRTALDNGATLIVGGLTRDGANLVARLAQQIENTAIPVLALNAPEGPAAQHFYFVTLSLDNEARQVAELAAGEGARRVAIIRTNAALARRVDDVFEKEWSRLGGEVAGHIAFSGDPVEAPGIRARLETLHADAVFLVAEPAAARFARPYVPAGMPVYGTSLAFEPRTDAMANVDLDGVRFLDMPWFVQPDHPAVMVYKHPDTPTSVEQERLYALGLDAWRLAGLIGNPGQRNPMLDGVTGRLTLDANHQFGRQLSSVEFRDGHVQPYKNGPQ